MTILCVSHEESVTGAPIALAEVARRLPGAVTWIQGSPPPPIVSQAKVALCNTVATWRTVSDLLAAGLPVVWWVHEEPVSVRVLCPEPVVQRLAAQVPMIFPTHRTRQLWREAFGPIADSSVVHYGVNRPGVLAPTVCGDPAGVILGVGTVDYRKGCDLFADVAHRVRMAQTAAGQAPSRFIWVGRSISPELLDGPTGSPVKLHPPTDNLAAWFAKASIFLCTSRVEPCGMAATEAMANGLPLVGFHDTGGLEEVVGDRARWVERLNPLAMAAAVIETLAAYPDEDRRHRQARAVQELFDWDACASHIFSVLQKARSL